MKKNTLFVSDLDGTLLNSELKVSERTATILQQLISDKNINFTVATARTPATAVPMTEKIGIKLPLIVMTGAAMWNPITKSYASTTEICRKNVDRIVEICTEHNLNPFVYQIDNNILNVQHSTTLSDVDKQFVAERINSPFKHFNIVKELQPTNANLIFTNDEFDKIEKVHSIITSTIECQSVCYHDIYNEGRGYMEIFAPGVTKANAIKQLAEKINADEIVVFGDNLNDIPMLKIADVAVAMDNAYPEVKAVANHVIGNNNDDSVARWIEEYVNTI